MPGQPLSKLELLPTELKLLILPYITDTKTLRSLIHASPTIHNFYMSHRERLFTQVTINELSSRDVDILTPAPLLEATVEKKDKHNRKRMQAAFEALYDQLDNVQGPITLGIDNCKMLLKIQVLLKWDLVDENVGSPDRICYREIPSKDSSYWFWGEQNGQYLMMYMGKERLDFYQLLDLEAAIFTGWETHRPKEWDDDYWLRKFSTRGYGEEWVGRGW